MQWNDLTVRPSRASLCVQLSSSENPESPEHTLKTDISEQIAILPSLTRAQLLPIWAENFNTAPPPKLRKELMVPILAYRIQEREYGGLSHSARARLHAIAKALPARRSNPIEASPNAGVSGVRLIRLWRGEIHEVFTSGDGYLYREKRFTSLSKIAREITGTQWSGPAFFGTKGKKSK